MVEAESRTLMLSSSFPRKETTEVFFSFKEVIDNFFIEVTTRKTYFSLPAHSISRVMTHSNGPLRHSSSKEGKVCLLEVFATERIHERQSSDERIAFLQILPL